MMNPPIKHARTTTLIIEDFVQNMRNDVEIKKLVGLCGIKYLTLKIRRVRSENQYFLSLKLSSESLEARFATDPYQCRITVINHQNPEKNVARYNRKCRRNFEGFEHFMPFDMITVANSGFLENGELTIRTEIRTDVIWAKNINWIRMINVYDPIEGHVKLTFSGTQNSVWVNKQIMLTHCTNFRPQLLAGKMEFSIDLEWSLCKVIMSMFVQDLHGLPAISSGMGAGNYLFRETLRAANYFGALHIFKNFDLDPFSLNDMPLFYGVIERKRVRSCKSLEKLQELVDEWKLNKLNADLETMKLAAKQFFSFV